MTQYTSLFVLLVALSGALSQFDGPPGVNHFDCRRKGISCTNGTCDTVGTTCSCDLSFTSVLNYHCVDSTVETTTCTDPAFCHNGGECRVVGGADFCFCPQHFTGTTCELPRLELTCDPTAMTVTVRPHGLFQGRMYANEQASDSNCLLSNADQAAVFENTFAYDPAAASHCGVAQSDLLAGFGTKVGTKYELSVIVQYSLDIITGQDQMLVANCSYPDLATAKGVIFEADATYLDPGAVGGEGSTPLVFDILGKTGSTLTAGQTVNVGDALTVTILLPTNAAFPEFLVDSCTAANGDDDTAADYESLKFVTTPGCLTDNQVARGVHVLETTATGKLVKIPIYAIMFVRGSSGNKNTLFFSCSVQLCDGSAGNASTCNAPTCTVDFTPDVVVERRRRAADGDTKVVGRALTVRFGNATQEEEFMHEEDGYEKEKRVRWDVDSLTVEEIQNIREALQAAKNDETISGYNQIAAFHGQPNWCPSPAAEKKYACCTHGMAVFPHWHRLLTVQAENALVANGLHIGLPYWDWTLPITSLPAIVKEEFYTNPKTGESTPNPLYNGLADGHPTTRSVRDELFEAPAFGSLTRIAEQVMLAFEQTDFCDFEVQYEIAQNYIHALVGGNEEYSMASLRYSAYDPIFFLHHSNTDRLWAIWQELQKYRGLPYISANCAIASLRQPLQPFAQGSVTNPDPVTHDHSSPFDVFNYENSFHYHYDNLKFNGMSIPQIQREVIKRAVGGRVFAGFMLHGVKKSSLVVFEICKPTGDCKKAGEFYLLGDEYELPWEFDRLFKYEITGQVSEFGLEPLDMYEVKYEVFDLARASLGTDIFGVPPQIYLSPYTAGQ